MATQLSNAKLLDLTNQVAIVTGGAMGIGQGIALRLAQAGAAVVIGDVDMEAAQQTVSLIAEQGGQAASIRCDMSKVSDIEAMVAHAEDLYGRLDILVNNAGVYPMKPALEVSESLWDRVLDINLKGVFFAAQAAARRMIAAGSGGRIINIASIDALHPTGYLAHYDASKGGVAMLTRSLAREYGPRHITVNAIAPGGISTPGAAAATGATGTATAASPAIESFMARIPLRRMGEPDDIATVALFLASPAASYVTGSLLVVDGGYLLS